MTQDDADGIFSYRSLDVVAEYQYWEAFTRKQTIDFIAKNKNCELGNQEEWAGLIIESVSERKVIGDCAAKIQDTKLAIGCNIAPQYQKRGFAKAAMTLLINHCLINHGISEIYGITDSRNIASIKLMQSLGMQNAHYEEKIQCKGKLCIEIKYSMEKMRSNGSGKVNFY